MSIHTLAAAGYEELVDILHHEGRRTRLEESSEIVIKPEFHALAQKMMRRAQNFFKHADKDPDGLLDFDPREPQFLLFACVDAYPTLTGRHLRELWSFLWWFVLEYPDYLKPEAFKDDLTAAIGGRTVARRDRRAFWMAFNRAPSPGCD